MSMSVSRGYSGAQVWTALRIASAQADIIAGFPPEIAWSRWSLWQCPSGVTGLRLRVTDRAGGSPKVWVYGGTMTDFAGMTELGNATGSNGYLDVTITGLTPGTLYAVAFSISNLKAVVTYDNITERCYSPTVSVNSSGVATITSGESGSEILYRINDGDWQDYTGTVQMPPNSYIYSIAQKSGKLESYQMSGYYFTD